ncbi:MAG: GspE/PulE family protein [Chloroflexota bacterium]
MNTQLGAPDPQGTGTTPAATLPAVAVKPTRRIGDLLLEARLITQRQLEEALSAQVVRRKRLGEILVEDRILDDVAVAAVLSVQLDAPLVDLRERPSEESALRLVSERDARRLSIMPLVISGQMLVIATGDPANVDILEEVMRLTGRAVDPLLALPSEIDWAIRQRYRVGDLEAQVSAFSSRRAAAAPLAAPNARVRARELENLRNTPVVQIVNLLVAQGLRDRASDIHIEPQAARLRVRARIDGVLRDVAELPSEMAAGLVSRIKILAELNIVEKQRAQDGQFSTTVEGRTVDIRVATMRTNWGEKVVMRLLDRERSVLQLTELGFPPAVERPFHELLYAPFGMIIVSGPTGSGKTTTLYASINELDRAALNVTTIEDPMEYTFENVNQTQVNTAAGITFASGLRAILRQDPDVILVGEMRDRETAEIAVQASLTGHLVLSSMHATEATSAVFRLLEMGIEPFLVAGSVTGVVAQRLIRRICRLCRIEIQATAEESQVYTAAGLAAPGTAFLGRGCTYCGGTGFLDRIGTYELLRVTPEMRRLISTSAQYEEIRAQAIADGMVPLRVDALTKAAAGVTTVAEALRSVVA